MPHHRSGQHQPADEMEDVPELVEISVRQPVIIHRQATEHSSSQAQQGSRIGQTLPCRQRSQYPAQIGRTEQAADTEGERVKGKWNHYPRQKTTQITMKIDYLL